MISTKINPWTFTFSILAILMIGMAIIGGIRSYSPVPFWDMFDGYVGFFTNGYSDHLSAWWMQHNEHRITLSRLLFWLDISLFQGRFWFLIVVNYFLLGVAYVFFYMMLKERLSQETEAFPLKILALVILVILFSWTQQENLVWAFQSAFFLGLVLPLIAFLLLHRSFVYPHASTRLFLFASLTGFASLGTLASGVLVLPLMTLFAVVSRMQWHRIICLILFTVIAMTLYFHNYNLPQGHMSAIDMFDHPLRFLQYVLYYLGGPFYFITGQGSHIIAALAGLFLITSLIFFVWKTIASQTKTSSLQLALVTFLIYICGMAVLTAIGQISNGVVQAFGSRYQTPVLMAWVTLIILFAPYIARVIDKSPQRFLGALLLIPLLLLPQQFTALQSQQSILFMRQTAALALELGINDQEQIKSIYPVSESAIQTTRNAVEQGFSIFGQPLLRNVNQLIGRYIEYPSTLQCQGSLDNIFNIDRDDEYVRVRGWLFQSNVRKSPRKIHILNKEGRIIGYALTGQSRPDVAKAIDPKAKASGYNGYLLTEELGQPIILIGSEPDCELMIPAPPI